MTANWRDRVAETIGRYGILRLLEILPGRSQLLVLNYHRIGRCEESELDRQVFSADTEGFDEQLRIIKRQSDLLHPMEAFDLIRRGLPLKRPAVMITFDDGYLDNYTEALPVLKANGVSACFFLVTGYLDDPYQVTWWDKIAYLVRQCAGDTIELTEPRLFRRYVHNGNVDDVINELLAIYRDEAPDEERFLAQLAANAGIEFNSLAERPFMNWSEARSMLDQGMVLGLHTHTHRILSRLDEDGQRFELSHSKVRMTEQLGVSCDVLAYPVGTTSAFNATTKRLVKEAGYRCAFSFGSGTNAPGAVDPFDVKRVALPSFASPARSRSAVSMMKVTRQVWF